MSVAIRAITRIQDADDVNVTLGVGVDEYALCWDNDTAKFVARAVAGVYLLATGATTGATSQAQAFTNGVVTPYDAPAADGVAAWQVRKADKTTAVLNVDTTNARVGIGTAAPSAIFQVDGSSGGPATANSLLVTRNKTSNIGFQIGAEVTRGWIRAVEIGVAYLTWGILNLGNNFLSLGCGANESQLYLNTATGLVGIGTTTPGTLLHGLLTSAATNAVTNILTIGHDTSGTAAAGFGAGVLFQLESSTTAAQSAARIQALWYEATHATRKADLVLTAYDTAEREGLRIRGAGSAPAIGFLGATPAARQAHVTDPAGGGTVDAEARSAINSILATLETFGFHATS